MRRFPKNGLYGNRRTTHRPRAKKTLFPVGDVVISEPAKRVLERCDVSAEYLIARHQRGDWANYDSQKDLYIAKNNDYAVKNQQELVSRYDLSRKSRQVVWVITNKERTQTKILAEKEHRE